MREQFAGWGRLDHKAVCLTCKKQHLIPKGEQISAQPWLDWMTKHKGHPVRLVPHHRLTWLSEHLARMFDPYFDFAHNADVKEALVASAQYTITLTGLASSSTLVAGRESTWISNSSNLYLDVLVSGKIGVNESVNVTAGTQVECHAVGSVNDTPTYPDTFTGTDSAVTITNTGIRSQVCRAIAIINCPSAANNFRTWWSPVGIRQLFGDGLPNTHGIWVVHNTGQNLGATASNQAIYYTQVYNTVTG